MMSCKVFVATRKGLFRATKQSGAWAIDRVEFLGDLASIVSVGPLSGAVIAGLGHGHFGPKIHVSEDGGESWREVASPTYPEKPEGLDDRTAGGAEVPWSVQQIWALEGGGASPGSRMWCGTIPGGLFSSSDDGATWELNRPLWDRPERREWFGGGTDYAGLHSVCVDPRDADVVTVGVSCGGVWQTRDGGRSWDCTSQGMRAAYMPPERATDPYIQDPHRIVQCPSEPDKMWAQHHNGIFKSTNGGRSWIEIQDVPLSSFGFAVAVHPSDGDTAWFVPAIKDELRIPVDGRLVVTRTRDGGESFDVLSDGLPQSHTYDLVFRHALDVSSDGDVLAFGSTTGSLWVSEDGGDTWTTVSQHLPPVYSVKVMGHV